jgi:hypothetical protein
MDSQAISDIHKNLVSNCGMWDGTGMDRKKVREYRYVGERIPEVLADTQQNNLGLEVTPFERLGGIHEYRSSQFSEYRRVYSILAIFATQPQCVCIQLAHTSQSNNSNLKRGKHRCRHPFFSVDTPTAETMMWVPSSV